MCIVIGPKNKHNIIIEAIYFHFFIKWLYSQFVATDQLKSNLVILKCLL
jgi:hypothetical protein